MNAKKCSLCEFTISGLEEYKNNSWRVGKKNVVKGAVKFFFSFYLTTHFQPSFYPIWGGGGGTI